MVGVDKEESQTTQGQTTVPVEELIKKTRTRRLTVRKPQKVVTGMPLRDADLVLSRPPALEGPEKVLERNLGQQMHREYAEMPWWERTWEFSQMWDHARRRYRAQLKSYFHKFAPRWQDPAWEDFNQGRRQADAHGARYEQWIKAVFTSMPDKEVLPSRLHGEPAIRAYDKYGPGKEAAAASTPSEDAPLADQVAEILAMAENIYGDDYRAGAKLIKESIEMGVLPPAAVETLPQRLRFAYEQEYRKGGHMFPKPSSTPVAKVTAPKVII